MKKLALVVAGLALLAVLALTTDSSGAAQKPKFTIGEVMQKAHKSGLWKKVAEGKGSDAEEKQLVEYYTALPLNKPPKGDAKAWKDKTTKMLDLAKKIEKGDKAAGAALLKEVNCKACHGTFRN